MRTSTIISILVALVVAIAAALLSLSYIQDEQAAAMQSAQQQIASQQPKLMIVVAAKNIAFGERLTEEKLTTITWYADQLPAGTFTDVNALLPSDSQANLSRHAMGSFQKGEPIHQSRITQAGEVAKLSAAIRPGYKAMSIRVNDVLGVAGFVLPGDFVDVFLTRKEKNLAYVDVLLQSVKVLAIDQLADDRTDQPNVVRTVTFEVDTRAAQRLTLGASVGILSLALRNLESTQDEASRRISMDLLGTGSSKTSKAVTKVAKKPASKPRPKPQPQLRPKAKVSPQPTAPTYATVSVIRGRGDREEYRVIQQPISVKPFGE